MPNFEVQNKIAYKIYNIPTAVGTTTFPSTFLNRIEIKLSNLQCITLSFTAKAILQIDMSIFTNCFRANITRPSRRTSSKICALMLGMSRKRHNCALLFPLHAMPQEAGEHIETVAQNVLDNERTVVGVVFHVCRGVVR